MFPRSASGHRTAEMKWSNHSRLSSYDVRIVGWPKAVPHRNPSTLSVTEIRALLDALENGSLLFMRADRGHGDQSEEVNDKAFPASGSEDEAAFSWFLDDSSSRDGAS
jgi:hypothetical protein